MFNAVVIVAIYGVAILALGLALFVVGPSLIRAGLALFDVDDDTSEGW